MPKTIAAAATTTTIETPRSVRIPIHFDETDPSNDDDVVDGGSYRRYDESGTSSSTSSGGGGGDYTDEDILHCDAGSSCGRFATFQANYFGPFSPERAPGAWMILNAFVLVWSLSLGVYLTLLYAWYGNEIAASKATTTDYLVWSLLTTLVWVVEISLRAAFPGLDTFLVVSTPTQSVDDDNETEDIEEQEHHMGAIKGKNNHNDPTSTSTNTNTNTNPGLFRRTFTMEESVVTLETFVQKRSKKRTAVIVTELLLAVYFVFDTVLECWKHWHHRHGGNDNANANANDIDDYVVFDEYYGYNDASNGTDNSDYYPMLQQQTDIWINVLAYIYMTHETYHEYHKSKTTRMDIHRSLSTTLLHQQPQPHATATATAAAATAAPTNASVAVTTANPRTATESSSLVINTFVPCTNAEKNARKPTSSESSSSSSSAKHATNGGLWQ